MLLSEYARRMKDRYAYTNYTTLILDDLKKLEEELRLELGKLKEAR